MTGLETKPMKKNTTPIDVHETKYGFNWGTTQVERVASHLGNRVILISTPRQALEIRITPTGLIRSGLIRGGPSREVG
jgi:hypothetical protein